MQSTLRLRTAALAALSVLPLAGYAASGNEQILEASYRWKLSDHLELTPDLQWIRRVGGDAGAPDFMAVGLRAAVGF